MLKGSCCSHSVGSASGSSRLTQSILQVHCLRHAITGHTEIPPRHPTIRCCCSSCPLIHSLSDSWCRSLLQSTSSMMRFRPLSPEPPSSWWHTQAMLRTTNALMLLHTCQRHSAYSKTRWESPDTSSPPFCLLHFLCLQPALRCNAHSWCPCTGDGILRSLVQASVQPWDACPSLAG